MNNKSNKRQEKRSEELPQNINIEDYLIPDISKPNFKTYKPTSPSLDYGTFNQFKLDDLINFQSDGFNETYPIRLAFVEHNSIHLQQHAIQVFQKYVKHELSFIGVYGKSGAGKSLMLDKVLNLCEFSGAYFTKLAKKQKGLYMWSVPLSKDNVKVFFIDVDGYQKETESSYFMLLDLMLFLSSSFLLVAGPNDDDFEELDIITHQIKEEKQKFHAPQNKFGSYWPNSVYCMLRKISISTNKKIISLQKMFNQVHVSVVGSALNEKIAKQQSGLQLMTAELKKFGNQKKLISEQYIKCLSSVIRDSISKIHVKVEMNLRFTGANLNKLIVNAIQHLNIKNYLNIEKIYKKSTKQLYIDAYNYHTQLYNQNLIQFLEEEEPMAYDDLIKVFKQSSDQVLETFKNLRVNEELQQAYSQKLQTYIAEKQRLIIEVNKKKLKNRAKKVTPKLKPKPSPQEFCQFIDQAKSVSKNYENIQELTQQLVSGMSHFQQTVGNQARVKQTNEQYSKQLQDKLSQLKNIQAEKKTKSPSIKQTLSMKINLQNKEKKLNEAISKLKIEVAKEKLDNPIKDSLKKSKSLQMLKMEELKLIQEKQAKEKIINGLKIKYKTKSKEQIQLIQSQINEKVSQQKQLENILSSNMRTPSIQVLKSINSLSSPRKVQSREFNSLNSNIRVISSKI